jgi:hypothetical protein
MMMMVLMMSMKWNTLNTSEPSNVVGIYRKSRHPNCSIHEFGSPFAEVLAVCYVVCKEFACGSCCDFAIYYTQDFACSAACSFHQLRIISAPMISKMEVVRKIHRSIWL